ncbi:aminopeptidase [Chryseobacterium sp. A321]
MKHAHLIFYILLLPFWSFAQGDSLVIRASLNENLKDLEVEQELYYTNKFSHPISEVELLNWIAAYRNEGTSLSTRKIEDRQKQLYFAKKEELGSLTSLLINDSLSVKELNKENLKIPLSSPLAPGETLTLRLKYSLSLPSIAMTGYGTSQSSLALKYFFLVPNTFETIDPEPRQFNDTEQTQSGGQSWRISLSVPQGYQIESNLKKEMDSSFVFSGKLADDPEFLISLNDMPTLQSSSRYGETTFVFGYPIEKEQLSTLSYLLPVHLNFLGEKLGHVPSKVFISPKFNSKEDFFGIDDIKFWKFRYKLFSDMEKTDLDYFSMISKKVIQAEAITQKSKDHWFKNGLQTYLEMQYLKENYKDALLIGKLPQEAQLFGIHPLRYLTAAKLKLTERYGLGYHYILTKNLDQKIGTPYPVLSNFNDMAISQFETGSLFNFIAEKMGTGEFEEFTRTYLSKNTDNLLSTKDFLDQLSIRTGYSSAFLEDFIYKNNRVNFKVKKFEKLPEGYLVKVTKNSSYGIPIQITSEDFEGNKKSFWYDSSSKRNEGQYLIPRPEVKKISVNDEYLFPESNFRDNYIYTKGLFSNTKRVKFKLLPDIPDPEYNEIYLSPKVTFNAYDKVLLGIGFKNKSFFDQPFQYALSPYFSTGTNTFAGSGGLSYRFRPQDAFFQNLEIGASASYFHYDYDLAYKKISVASTLNFSKVLRSDISRALYFSFSHFEKDLTPELIAKGEYDRYGLWSLGYGYNDKKIIHEISFGSSLQLMNDFQKLSAEAYYRWEYAQNKKISFRWFGGVFFKNEARNNLFDFGVSRVSNYAFNYSLLGQSATEGILSQQYVQAEGGFKSHVGEPVSRWISSVGVDAHIWKLFNLYADAGVYKNKGQSEQFIWDSGVKLKVIPDFLEVYFPLQSSLGFEPSLDNYGKRIRFTLILNLSALTSHFRKGWY